MASETAGSPKLLQLQSPLKKRSLRKEVRKNQIQLLKLVRFKLITNLKAEAEVEVEVSPLNPT
jgi:hypothetical protein